MSPALAASADRTESAGPDPWEVEIVAAIRAASPGGPAAEAAWGSLLHHYQDRLYAVCLRMIRDPDTARDLTQDTLVKIINGFDSFDARARLSTWMTRIAMNVCLSHLRKQKLRRHPSLDAPFRGDPGEDADSFANGLQQTREVSPGERIEARDERDALLRAMALLEPDHRAALVLRDVRGLDYQEIADVLDIPVGTVKSRLFRARTALRAAIDADLGRTGPPPDEEDTFGSDPRGTSGRPGGRNP